MNKKIIWSSLAENDFVKILEYLQENWEEKVINKFIEKIELVIHQIAINPSQYSIINKSKKIRKCVLSKHNTLFYKVSNQSIDILRIYDTRQNPNNLKFS